MSRHLIACSALLLATAAAHAQCPKATNLQVSPTVCNIPLFWQNAPGAGPATGWWVFRRQANSIAAPAIIATLPPGTLTYVDTPPQRGVAYEYFVSDASTANPCPINQTSSSVVTAQLLSPTAPVAAYASYPDCNRVDLIWSIVTLDPTVRVTLELASGTIVSDVVTTNTSFTWTRNDNAAPLPTLAKIYALSPCGVQSAPALVPLQLQTLAIRPVAFTLTEAPCSIRLAFTPHPQQTGPHRIDRRNAVQPSLDVASFTIPAGTNSFVDTGRTPGVAYVYTLAADSPCSPDAPFGQSLVGTPIAPAALGQLAPAKAPRAAIATLALSSPPTGTDVSFSWRKGVSPTGAGGTTVANSARVSGAAGPALTISGITLEDADLYALDITSPCGTETRVTALAVAIPCLADTDGSGARTIDDIFIYLNAWFAGCP